MCAQPGHGLCCRRCGDWHREERAKACPHHVGVVQIGAAADDHGMDAGGIGCPQDGAQIAGLFRVFNDDDKRVMRAGAVAQALCPDRG